MKLKMSLASCALGCLVCGGGLLVQAAAADFSPDSVKVAVERGLQEWQEAKLESLAASMAKTEAERKQVMEGLRAWAVSREMGDSRVVTIDGAGDGTALVCALCSTDRGWFPTFFDCKEVDGRLEAHRIREPGSEFTGRNGMSDYIAGIRAKMEDWRAVQGGELAAKTEGLKKRLAGEMAAVKMANRDGLRIVHGYGTEESFARKLSALEKLSPEEIREQVLAELEAALATMVNQ